MNAPSGRAIFDACRKRLWNLFDHMDMEFHKSYEGAIDLTYGYDGYFESDTLPERAGVVRITLHCYVLGSGRHHDFVGHSLRDAAQNFSEWLDEMEKMKSAK